MQHETPTTTTNTATETLALDDLHTVKDLAARYPKILSVPILRWQLRSRDTNGLAHCCVPVGRNTLISLTRYESWLATRAGRPA